MRLPLLLKNANLSAFITAAVGRSTGTTMLLLKGVVGCTDPGQLEESRACPDFSIMSSPDHVVRSCFYFAILVLLISRFR